MAVTARQVYLSNLKPGRGVKEDFNAFLHHFTERNTLRYEDFAELWKELQMPYMLAGRIDYELQEAVGYSFSCAVDIFNSSTNIQTRTCAIYLLYAVYETQGLFPQVRIRVTVAQFALFSQFVELMAEKQHYDFVFVFTRLRMERAFLYVATVTPQGKQKRKLESNQAKAKEVLPTSLVSTFSDISLDLVEELSAVNEEYFRVKCVTTRGGTGNASAPHPSVDLTKPEFIRDMTRQVARFDNWRKTGQWKKKVSRRRAGVGGATTSESEADNPSDSDSAVEATEETIAEKRQRIRDKAFATVGAGPRSSRYRKMVAECSQSDGPGATSPARRRSASKRHVTGRPKALTLRDAEELASTNAYLQVVTAPSKKERRRRRAVQRLAQRLNDQDQQASGQQGSGQQGSELDSD